MFAKIYLNDAYSQICIFKTHLLTGLFLNEFEDAIDREFGGAFFTDTDGANNNFTMVNFTSVLDIFGHTTNIITVCVHM